MYGKSLKGKIVKGLAALLVSTIPLFYSGKALANDYKTETPIIMQEEIKSNIDFNEYYKNLKREDTYQNSELKRLAEAKGDLDSDEDYEKLESIDKRMADVLYEQGLNESVKALIKHSSAITWCNVFYNNHIDPLTKLGISNNGTEGTYFFSPFNPDHSSKKEKNASISAGLSFKVRGLEPYPIFGLKAELLKPEFGKSSEKKNINKKKERETDISFRGSYDIRKGKSGVSVTKFLDDNFGSLQFSVNEPFSSNMSFFVGYTVENNLIENLYNKIFH